MRIRNDLAEAQVHAWRRIGQPGTWWSAADRVAIAAETRHAAGCPLCQARKAALSPGLVGGDHSTLGKLSGEAVEAVHRIRTDSGRLGEAWFRRLQGGTLTDARYVELVAVVVVTVAVDSFCAATGLQPFPLPAAAPGEPTRQRPAGARPGVAWTDTLLPEDRTAADPDLYRETPGPRERAGANIHLALSLVPESMIQWWDMFEVMYMPGPWMRDYGHEYRAITHPQMEMLAARVAALNRCEY